MRNAKGKIIIIKFLALPASADSATVISSSLQRESQGASHVGTTMDEECK